MGLKPELLDKIKDKGYESPTPIQEKSIPPALKGNDIMGQAQTGTGKTAAFAIPMLNNIIKGAGLQGLVLCPTRELAVQVANEITSLGKKLRIFCLPIYGGQSIEIQIRSLYRKPEILVATPGRLLDHIDRKNIDLSQIKFVVLDEADEMLDMGFVPDVESILSLCPLERQTFLFSATLMEPIRKLGKKFMVDPQIIEIAAPELTVSLTQQFYYQVNPYQKVETICRVIDVMQPPVSLIFCRTKKGADNLAHTLDSRGYPAESLHGDMSQRERDMVMERFRSGNIRILVATDLAARGLDVDMITHVFNFDVPEDPDVYVHRIGRTGRAGRDGIAITLIEKNQIRQLKLIEKHTGKKIKRQILPSLQEAVQKRREIIKETLLENCQEDLDIYQDFVQELLQEQSAEVLLAAAIKIMLDEGPELETAEIEILDRNSAHVELPIGRRQGANPRRLVEFITENTSLWPRQVGDIEIQNNSCLVEVPIQSADEVYALFEHNGMQRWNQRGRKRSNNKQRPFRPRRVSANQ
jgi:ATP-dependent RNA helicase DeaD